MGGLSCGRAELWEGRAMGGQNYGRAELWEGRTMGGQNYGRADLGSHHIIITDIGVMIWYEWISPQP